MKGVLFIVMPFGAVDAPQVGISTLQAQLRADGVPCDIAYFNLTFAAGVGLTSYAGVSMTSGELFLGEWLFAGELFPPELVGRHQAYVEQILRRSTTAPPGVVKAGLAMVNAIPSFLDYCMNTIDWDRYTVIGFTTMFEQNGASLALAKRIKARYPDKIVVMGGSNCAGLMGVQLHRSFPFLDYVFTGEADVSFPLFIKRLATRQPMDETIKGFVWREGGVSVESPLGDCLADLDRLPYPYYDDFFEQYTRSGLPPSALTYLMIETGRGCWWGQKDQCRFCGINHAEIAFRTKSPARALTEMEHMVARYAIHDIMPVDNIIGLPYFKTLLPELRRRGPHFSLFYESKANLKEEQVKMLAEAGVTSIQPGIESFSENVLGLMHKGVTPLQNLQLIKWCRQYGITPMWNLLYGFPGENARDYTTNLAFVEAMMHLHPPMGFGHIRLERFSPLFEEPAKYGIRDVRPAKPYTHIYPVEDEALFNIAYFFDCDFAGKEKIERWFAPIGQALECWQTYNQSSRLEVVQRTTDALLVHDTRPTRVQPTYHFTGLARTVVDFCNELHTFDAILEAAQASVEGAAQSEAELSTWLQEFLDYLVAHRLALHSGNRYLSVILPQAPPPLRSRWQRA